MLKFSVLFGVIGGLTAPSGLAIAYFAVTTGIALTLFSLVTGEHEDER